MMIPHPVPPTYRDGAVRHSPRGYVLFEVILALTIFAMAVLSLANSLNSGVETAAILNRDNAVRIALRSFVEEVRRKEVGQMQLETTDTRLGATFSSTVQKVELNDRNGVMLSDLYLLKAQASYGEGNDARQEIVNVYVYKPAQTPSS